MAQTPYAATYTAGAALAGSSDTRQAPDRAWGAAINRYSYAMLSLIAEYLLDENDKAEAKHVRPTIASKSCATLIPEQFDDEYSPQAFRLATDVNVTEGSNATIVLESTDSILAGDLLQYNNLDNFVQLYVVSNDSATNLTCKATKVGSGGGTATLVSSTDSRMITKLNPSFSDRPTVGDGYQQEMIRRINYLMTSIWPISEGFLQNALSLQGSPTGEGIGGDFERRKRLLMGNALKNRNDHMIGSAFAYIDGTGTSKKYISKGLLGWVARNAVNVGDGSLSYENFTKNNLQTAFEAGNSGELYMLAGPGVVSTINNLLGLKYRMDNTNIQNEFGLNIKRVETDFGILNIVRDAYFSTDAFKYAALTFDPKKLTRRFLRGLDFKFRDNLELSNILGNKGAWVCVEALMSAGETVTLHTNIQRAAA